MSASKKKQARQAEAAVTQPSETVKERSYGALYAVVGAIVAVVVIALLVWNSGLLRNDTAVTIGGEDYTAADLNFYYQNNFQYGAYSYGMMGMYDPTKAPEDQMFDEETQTTWRDFFIEQSVEDLRQEAAMAAEAKKAGMTLSEESQAAIDAAMVDLETGRVTYGYTSVDAYLKANLGSEMTKDKYVECLERSVLAGQYATEYAKTLTCEQSEVDGYYLEHKDEMDTYTTTVFQFQAKVETTDAQGNTIEMTEEETAAALEAAKQTAKAEAEALLAELESGADAQALADKYADSLSYSSIGQNVLGSGMVTHYTDWAFDPQRQAGDITLIEYAGGIDTLYNYCVIRLEDRFLDEQPTADIRHILVAAGAQPTDAEYESALTQAQELVAEFEANGATEDAFTALAVEHSADTATAEKGGSLNVSTYDGYGQAFVDWALDPAREVGEVGYVKNDFSTTKGYHIMYYMGQAEPYWNQMARAAILSEEYTAWQKALMDNYTAQLQPGVKYVG